MKTIAVNSTKGGTGKSTLSIILVNALTAAGKKCLAVDADMINHSLSFYYNSGIPFETILSRNIFKVFTGEKVPDNIISINSGIDLLHADVRLTDFRSTDSFKRFKRALDGLDYDFVIIDTAPTYDNVIVNILMASDMLLIPIQQDIFNYQSIKYQFGKLAELELDTLDIHMVFNQFDKPRTENRTVFSNQITDLFLEDTELKDFINPCFLSKSNIIKKYINNRDYHINGRLETEKQFSEIITLIKNLTGIIIKEEL